MKIINRILFLALASTFVILLIVSNPISVKEVDAQDLSTGINDVKTKIVDPDEALLSRVSADAILERIINWILGLSAIIALAVLVWGGTMYILSLGDEQKAASAKRIILYAVIGLLLVGASFAIIKIVESILITTP